MNIAFVLPNIQRKPGGGAKVVFQYANYIGKNRNTVTIYYMTDRFLKGKLPDGIRRKIGQIYSCVCPNWYRLDRNVTCKAAFDESDISNKHDVIIATAVMTAFFVDKLPYKCKKFYFIQGFETFYTSEAEVFRSYRLNLKKIVISKWLQHIVSECTGYVPRLISNGIDLSVFNTKVEILKRSRHSIVFHYREAPLKGCEYGIMVIEHLIEKYPDIEINVVGNVSCPSTLKGKCKYYKNITEHEVADINNRARVFMCTSIEEGFGLPGLEAMACGCALVTTDFEGSREYTNNGINALVCSPRDSRSLTDNVIKLFEDDDMACQLSKNAIDTAKKFDLRKTTQLFLESLT